MTPLHRNSKFTTALLLDDAADIYVDHSPERTDLVDQTTWVEEVPSGRAALEVARTVAVVASITDADTGVLVRHGDAGGYGYRISIGAGGEVRCAEAGALKLAATLPGVGAGAQRFLVHWAKRVDGSAVLSELALFNYTTGAWHIIRATHSSGAVSGTDGLTVGAGWGGAETFSGSLAAVHGLRIDWRFISTTEAAGDWVAEVDPPELLGRRRDPLLAGAADDLEVAADGDLCGPAQLVAGAATLRADQRLAGAFVNCVPPAPHTERLPLSPPQFYRVSPDGAEGWRLCLRYLWHGYLPQTVNVARVRAHVRAFDIAAAGPTISPLRLRVFSLANLILAGLPDDPELVANRGPVVTLETPNGAGDWVDLGTVRLAREDTGLSYLALGFLIDATEDEGDSYFTGFKVQALTADPFAQDLEPDAELDKDNDA